MNVSDMIKVTRLTMDFSAQVTLLFAEQTFPLPPTTARTQNVVAESERGIATIPESWSFEQGA